MKKRVISWLLCLALCLSMLPMAALAEDVQAPEGPAPSLNEPQPEPRAKENETPAPESGAKIQSELMTAEKLLMPLSDETPSYVVGEIHTEQNNKVIGTEGILGESTRISITISNLTAQEIYDLVNTSKSATLLVNGKSVSLSIGGSDDSRYVYYDFTPNEESYTVVFSITGTDIVKKCTLSFKKCTHVNDDGRCSQCGATLVAEINSATYYASLSEALDAAQTIDDCTITLLDDAGLSGDYTVTKGKFTIDLKTFSQGSGTINVAGTADVTVKNESAGQFEGNFCWSSADAKLTLAEGSAYADLSVTAAGKTIADLLPGDCGYQVSGN